MELRGVEGDPGPRPRERVKGDEGWVTDSLLDRGGEDAAGGMLSGAGAEVGGGELLGMRVGG